MPKKSDRTRMNHPWLIAISTIALNLAPPHLSFGQIPSTGSQTNSPLAVNLAQRSATLPQSHYRDARSYSTQRDPDPPRYVRELSKSGLDAFKDLTWLDVGLDYRFRYEYRQDDIRRNRLGLDQPLLHRTRAYLGIKEIADPFRFAVELTDSRRYNSGFARDNRDVNEFEPTMLYAELYLASLLGHDELGNPRPLSLRAGRMNFEFLDRRLLGNNQWRNTPNTFDGFRATLGREDNDWQLDMLAVQPNFRLQNDVDEPTEGQWIFGAIGHWRGWSDIIILEPYYLMLRQAATAATGNQLTPQFERELHSVALRGYGLVGQTGFDFDFDAVYQFGYENTATGSQATRAFGLTSEIGYTFTHAWKPRLSAFYGYASGDRDPGDNRNQQFERFYGFARPWSANDYIVWENISTPKLRLEFQPHKKVRVDAGHSLYWLASDTDRFNNLRAVGGADIAYRDPTGRSGSFIGHEFDIRSRHQVTSKAEVTVGYSHFFAGGFTRSAGHRDSDFFYVEVLLNAF